MGGFTISGVRELLTLHPVPIHVQSDEAPWVKRVTDASDSDLVLHESGDTLMVGDIPIELIHTPGHTPGSQCFFVDGKLVAGDTLFLEGCGRLDLPGGDPAAMYDSLTQKLAKVPDDAILFPGHQYSMEPSASMGETRRMNYVFRPKTAEQWLMMFGNG
jgi:glyoxylase-like metal-dependent hydrolase (beta-lactamase superfamily II)